jgi:hypothetical protein
VDLLEQGEVVGVGRQVSTWICILEWEVFGYLVFDQRYLLQGAAFSEKLLSLYLCISRLRCLQGQLS